MRAIVTGGAGFVGSHLVEALLARGDEVVCVERPGALRGWVAGFPVAFTDCGIEDPECLTRAFRGAGVVYHLAALTQAVRPEDFDRVNALGTANVVEAASRQPVAPRVVFMSSLAALGPCRNGESLSERSVPHPLSRYGQSKLAAEIVLHGAPERVPWVILRFSSVYGPRERAVLRLFQMVRRGVAVTVGGWDREVSLIYAADAVNALIAAGTSPRAPGRTFCIAHPEAVTWEAFARSVGQALRREPWLLSIAPGAARVLAMAIEESARWKGRPAVLNRERVREVSQARWVCDPSAAIEDIGFRPAYPVRAGARETAAWYEKAGWL
jgi:nucleoside-diphosphate-sugar epimerase